LSRVDFPAFGSPIRATNPARVLMPLTFPTSVVPRPVQPGVLIRP
jgi:hypothetical protein